MVSPTRKRAALIGAGVLGAGLILTGFAKTARAAPAKPECPPFAKIRRNKLKAIVAEAVEGGMKGLERIASHVGQLLFPTDPVTNQPIPWPKTSPYVFPPGTSPATLCLYNELKKIISELGVPEAPAEPDSPAKVYNEYASKDPVPGKFWKVKKGWIASGKLNKSMLFQALKRESQALASSGSDRLDYLRCMTQSHWNRSLYGAPRRSQKWNDAYGFDTPDGEFWLWPAFMPWHEDAIARVVNGEMPERQITPNGERIKGGEYGLLWLPPIDPEVAVKNNAVACNLMWPDGSSTLEPPPELIALLK